MGLGPRDEKKTTEGAMISVHVSVVKIVAVGFLNQNQNLH